MRSPPARRVLVVDDVPDSRETLVLLLQIEGHEAIAASSGPMALELALAWRPDVALLDLGLPGMDGTELARRLRALPELAGLRLAALTGYARPQDRERTKAAGFDAHFAKPVDPDVLLEWVATGRARD